LRFASSIKSDTLKHLHSLILRFDMSETQETAAAAQEPSMEEILASIRKIISDDAPPAAATEEASEAVELTQMIEDDGSVVDIVSTPAPQEAVMSTDNQEPQAQQPVVPAAEPEVVANGTLLSEPAVSASASAISALASTVEIERLAASSSHGDNMALGNGRRTLEDLVIELMRPLLKDWLDKNLPSTVDRLVQREIERISRRAKE
jgi:uncharacterized protein